MTAWMNGVAMKMRKAEAGGGGVGSSGVQFRRDSK